MSLTFRCVSCVALYAFAIAVAFGVARLYSQHILSASSLSIETLIGKPDVLANDRFDVLASMVSAPNEVIVYDDTGTCLYASTADIAQRIPFDDLFIVASSVQENVYYEVIEHRSSSNAAEALTYEILLIEYHEDTETSEVIGSCVCDETLQIVEGDLFSGTGSLSADEFALIRGNYGRNMQIERHEYKTDDGSARTLVLATPKLSERVYRNLLNESEKVWPWAVLMALVLTCVAVVVVFHIIRGSMRPLENAIQARREGKKGLLREDDLPIELRDTYRSFVELMDVLDEAHEESQTIIADVSHDLKTPLAVIGGYARAFEDGCVPEDKQSVYLHAIYEKSNTVSQLLDALLTVSQLNHPAFEPRLVICDLCEQVRLSVIAASAEVEQAGDDIEVDIADKPLWTNLDKALFARVMGNIISNACKHNGPGIRIFVRCRETEDHAVVSVADNGVGFPPNLKEHAFEPFVTQNTARELGKGSGLGLAIAKKGVQVHGGSISLCDSPTPPYMTEVMIELPFCANCARKEGEYS